MGNGMQPVSMASSLRLLACPKRASAFRTRRPIFSKFSSYSSQCDSIEDILLKPSWSVRSFLPGPSDDIGSSQTVSPEQLHHLLRLSALPQPRDGAEEAALLQTLRSQIHFVRQIQKIDTRGVSPLVALRDETEVGVRESTITLEAIQDALALEKPVGRNGKIKRQEVPIPPSQEAQDWDALKMTEDTVGRFFVVRKAKAR